MQLSFVSQEHVLAKRKWTASGILTSVLHVSKLNGSTPEKQSLIEPVLRTDRFQYAKPVVEGASKQVCCTVVLLQPKD